MKIHVRFRNQEPSAELRAHATRRIHFYLSRFGEEISSIGLRISDVNGPKGGLDQQCQVTVRGRRLSTVVIEELRDSSYAAIDLALERAGHAVGRDLERARTARAPRLAVRSAS
jgi:putative sigma-54 modulation protein